MAWGGQRFVVCAFYTPNYIPQIQSLRASLDAFRLNHYLKMYASKGSWEENTLLKAHFIEHCMEKYNSLDVAYLDADSIVRSYPELFDHATADVTILFSLAKRTKVPALRTAAGTLYVRNTPGGLEFARRWAEKARNAPKGTVDEDVIYPIFPNGHSITFSPLPRGYYKIYDDEKSRATPVIEHFQASRAQPKIKVRQRLLWSLSMIAISIAALAICVWLAHNISFSWRR